MGRVRFVSQGQPAVEEGKPVLDWSGLESRLGELARLSSESSSSLVIEPHVALAHDPNNRLPLFERLNSRDQLRPINWPASSEASDPAAQAQPGEQQVQAGERGRDPVDMLSLLAPISSTDPEAFVI